MTNQLTKVRTCQSRKNAPKTTAAVRRAMTTVLITCEGEMRTHTTASLGTEASGSAGGTLRGFVCASVPGFACVSFWLISLWPLQFVQGVHPHGAHRASYPRLLTAYAREVLPALRLTRPSLRCQRELRAL